MVRRPPARSLPPPFAALSRRVKADRCGGGYANACRRMRSHPVFVAFYGVYVAENTSRGAECRAKRGAQRSAIFLSKKALPS